MAGKSPGLASPEWRVRGGRVVWHGESATDESPSMLSMRGRVRGGESPSVLSTRGRVRGGESPSVLSTRGRMFAVARPRAWRVREWRVRGGESTRASPWRRSSLGVNYGNYISASRSGYFVPFLYFLSFTVLMVVVSCLAYRLST